MENKPILTTATGMSRKVEVSWLQQRLKDKGYAIKVDGIFGTETDRVVREFQKANNIRVDGIVGQGTYAALEKDAYAKLSTSEPWMYPIEPSAMIGGQCVLRPTGYREYPIGSSDTILGGQCVIRSANSTLLTGASTTTLTNENESWANKFLKTIAELINNVNSFMTKHKETIDAIDTAKKTVDFGKNVDMVVTKQTYDRYILNDTIEKTSYKYIPTRNVSRVMKKALSNNDALLSVLKDLQKFVRTPLRRGVKSVKEIILTAKVYLDKIWKIIKDKINWNAVKNFANKRLLRFFKKIPLPWLRLGLFLKDFWGVITEIINGNFEKAFQNFCNAFYSLIVDVLVGAAVVALFAFGLWAVALILIIIMFALDVMFGDKIEAFIDNMASTFYNSFLVRS